MAWSTSCCSTSRTPSSANWPTRWPEQDRSGECRPDCGPPQQEQRDRNVQQIEQNAVDKGRPVGPRQVEDRAGHPSAECHTEERRGDDRADALARFPWRKILAHDDRIGRHDPSLEEPELFFFKQKTAYEVGLGIPAEPLFRSMVTLHEVITFLVSMQISISSLQTHNVNRCGRSRHLARKLSLRRKRSSPNVFEMAATETITSIILIKLIRVSLGTVRHPRRFK